MISEKMKAALAFYASGNHIQDGSERLEDLLNKYPGSNWIGFEMDYIESGSFAREAFEKD